MTTGSSLVPLDTSTSLQQQHLQKCAPIRVRLNAGWCYTACVVVVFLVNSDGQNFFVRVEKDPKKRYLTETRYLVRYLVRVRYGT